MLLTTVRAVRSGGPVSVLVFLLICSSFAGVVAVNTHLDHFRTVTTGGMLAIAFYLAPTTRVTRI